MSRASDQISRSYLKEQYDKYWPERKDDWATQKGNEPLSLQDPDFPKEYDPLDLDTPDGMAKALSYISSDKSLDVSPLPKAPISGWVTEELLKVGRHTKVTAAGRIFSFSALVMIGTKEGTAGIGYGRGPTVMQAIELARLSAEKNAVTLNLHRGNSIGKDIICRYKKSWVRMKCCRTGWGINAGWDMKQVLTAFGIEDVSVKQGGARNRGARYRAIFLTLRDQVRTKEQVAKMLGRKLFNKSKAWYNSGE